MSAPLAAELERATAAMRRHGLDVLLLTSPPNVSYVGGFEAPLPAGYVADVSGWLPAVAVLAADGSGSLVVNDADAAAARRSWWADVRTFDTLGQTELADPPGSFARALREALREAGLAGANVVVGVEPTMPRIAGDELAAVCPRALLRDATEAIESARRLKTAREVELLRRAVSVADAGQQRLVELAERFDGPTTDLGLWAAAGTAMEALTGHPLAVSGWLVTGTATSDWQKPGPSGREAAAGDAVLADLGPRVDGYWADCANTTVLGADPTPEQRRYIDASREACLEGIEALRPGRPCSDVWKAVREALGRFGIPIAHCAGHEIGVAVNERPRCVPYDATPIEPDMVFAVEAGAYAGPGGAVGARSERMALVTAAGPEILSAFGWGA